MRCSKEEQGNGSQSPAEMEIRAAAGAREGFQMVRADPALQEQSPKPGKWDGQTGKSCRAPAGSNTSRKSEPKAEWGKHTALRASNDKGFSFPEFTSPTKKCAPVETEAATAPRVPPATAEAPPATTTRGPAMAPRRSSATK